MIDFLEIQADKVKDVLHFVSEAMPEFKSSPGIDWEPEHVYGSLFLGLAQLTILMEDGSPIGFVVSRWMIQSAHNKNYLHIWLFWLNKKARGNIEKTKAVVSETIDYLWGKCLQNHGAYMEIPTTRRGWDKVLPQEFELELYTFRKRA